MTAPHPLGDRRTLALYAAGWLPLALAYSVGIAAAGVPPASAVLSAGLTIGIAAVLGAPVVGVAARLAGARLGAGPVGARLAAAHAWRALAYATLWVAGTAWQVYAAAPPRGFHRYLEQSAAWQWVGGLFLYGLLAGVGHAVGLGRVLRERDAAAARAELYALRAQLDPHFLFNTLHSLTALARRDPAAVERGLERFGGLLRYVLEANQRERPDAAGDADVPLDEELAFVRNYLALERLRLGDRLRVCEAVDDEARECALPALTLQPLVANAVRHGVAPRASGGTVQITARVDDRRRLVIEIGDDGAGCDPARVDAAGGLGVRVVRRRLRARYGEAGQMETVTAPDQGFVARVTLPARAPRVARPGVRPARGAGLSAGVAAPPDALSGAGRTRVPG